MDRHGVSEGIRDSLISTVYRTNRVNTIWKPDILELHFITSKENVLHSSV